VQDLFRVAGKVVLVTGGSRGIGLAIAEGFVRAGARVYICSRDAAACDSAADALSAYGECLSLPADLGGVEGCRALAAEVTRRESRLDVLVNNAGAIWAEALSDYPESGWDKVFDLNVKGSFFLVQALLPLLEAAASREDPARIITVGSIDAFHVPQHETYAYTASKAAVVLLTEQMALEWAPLGLRVNAVAPGLIETDMTAVLSEEIRKNILSKIPLGTLGTPDDIASMVAFLASAEARYITGQVLTVDGGMVM
jgi:NAD(P)-dependent dehydrogenase (short-subunit alcohol dehydrogenase family)